MSRKLLEGIKVADFTGVYAGPLMTRTMAHYGAEVIKIEGRTRLDVERTHGPYRDDVPGPDRSGTLNELGTSKLSLALNLASPKATQLAKKIVAWADVVVENFSGGTMDRMGLGYDKLRRVKPNIVMLSTSMQGQTGPYALHRGFGMQLTALAGYDHIVGWPDREPERYGVYTDYIVARFGLAAIMAALDYRARTGKGQYLDMSQYEAAIQFIAPLILDYHVNQQVANRQGNRCNQAAPHGAYRCRGEDRWCAITVFTDEEWRSFCKAIGDPVWTKDPRFASLQARKRNEDELDKVVEEWTINYLAEEVMILMQTAGVAAGLVETIQDLMDHDPQLRHSHFYWQLEHPEVGMYRATRPPFLASKATYEVRSAPLLGEHNEYVCKQILNLSDDEIADLVIEGVIE